MVKKLLPTWSGVFLIASLIGSGCASINGSSSGYSSEEKMAATSLEALRRGGVVFEGPLKSVYFDFDRYTLTPDARETLKRNASWLRNNPGVRVQIEGHADDRGTNEYNLALGAKRAETSKEYLVSLGIPEQRFLTISYGEEVQTCKVKAEECWQQNRRSHFVVVSSGPAS